MPKYDLRDEYGQKIGEMQEKPFSGGNSYDVRDKYGQKVGEVRQDNSSEVAGNIIWGLAVVAFWLVVGVFWLAWKILTVGLPIFFQGIATIFQLFVRTIAAYFRALLNRPKVTIPATIAVGAAVVFSVLWLQDYNTEQERIAAENGRIYQATYVAQAPTRTVLASTYAAQATSTALAAPTATLPATVLAGQQTATAQYQQCANTVKMITPTVIPPVLQGAKPTPDPAPTIELTLAPQQTGNTLRYHVNMTSDEISTRRVDIVVTVDALVICPGGESQWLTFTRTTYGYISSYYSVSQDDWLAVPNEPAWFRNFSVNNILQFRNFRYAIFGYGLDRVYPLVFKDVPISASGASQIASTAAIEQLVVANTGGEGVYIRRTPQANDKIVAWRDGTKLEVIGEDVEGEGRNWKHVRDPKGNEGYVPAEFTSPSR